MIESRARVQLTATGLACIRGGRTLFTGLSFSIAAGELLLLSGPNGSGKTSLLRQAAGLLPLDAGNIACAGFERVEETHFFGFLPAIKDTLSVSENLAFWCALYGSPGLAQKEALSKLKLTPLADLPARVLSAGQRRRLALARLIAIRRKLWLLDEPDTALDTEGRETLLAVIEEHRASGGMVMLASHGTLEAAPTRELRLASTAKAAA